MAVFRLCGTCHRKQKITVDGNPICVACNSHKVYVAYFRKSKISVLDVDGGALVNVAAHRVPHARTRYHLSSLVGK